MLFSIFSLKREKGIEWNFVYHICTKNATLFFINYYIIK